MCIRECVCLRPHVLDKCQGEESVERCPNNSSLVCLTLPLCRSGRRCSSLLALLPHTVLIQCLFIIQLLELLVVLMPSYPQGTFTNRVGKLYSSLISVIIQKCILGVKHGLCFIKLLRHIYLLKPGFLFRGYLKMSTYVFYIK